MVQMSCLTSTINYSFGCQLKTLIDLDYQATANFTLKILITNESFSIASVQGLVSAWYNTNNRDIKKKSAFLTSNEVVTSYPLHSYQSMENTLWMIHEFISNVTTNLVTIATTSLELPLKMESTNGLILNTLQVETEAHPITLPYDQQHSSNRTYRTYWHGSLPVICNLNKMMQVVWRTLGDKRDVTIRLSCRINDWSDVKLSNFVRRTLVLR